jgi:hypothetical protein
VTAPVLSLEECANGYCLAMTNAYRLIEDGEKLLIQRRFLGAIGCFQAALDELVVGFLISKAVTFADDDEAAWENFWAVFHDRAARRTLLEREIHPRVYRDADAEDRYGDGHRLLPFDFVATTFDDHALCFVPPGGGVMNEGNERETAGRYYEYIMGLFHAFNFYGLPNPAAQAKTFWAMKNTPFDPN